MGRILFKKRKIEKESSFYATSITDHTLANGFTDDISEVSSVLHIYITESMVIAEKLTQSNAIGFTNVD